VRKSINDVVVLTFLPGETSRGEDIVRADEAFSALGNAVQVVLNLSYLQSATSLFLGMLLAFRKKIASVGGTLKVCGLTPLVAEVFHVAHFDKLFEIYPDEQAAFESF
jgi:anti-sigma B factor antagonist